MLKRFGFLGVMITAVGLPYLASSSSDLLGTLGQKFGAESSSPAVTTAIAPPVAPASPAGQLNAANQTSPVAPAKALPLEGYAAQNLGDVLQFDGTPGWVMARWPRVTSGLAELDLQGYRVPLVTGTRQDDLAGSLTYYFDKNQRMTRINFRGTTGDPRKLVALVVSRYGFERQATNDPGLSLYQVRWNGKPISELRVRPARIVKADQPFSRFEVELAMKRP